MPAKPKILVIDDDRDIVKLIEAQISRMGYEVIPAYNGLTGIEEAEKSDPDLVLLDITMPDIDGFEVVQRLKADEKTAFIPIILLTVKTDLKELVKGLELGADEFIVKPFSSMELLARIKAMLRIKALQDKLRGMKDEVEKKLKRKIKEVQNLYMLSIKALAVAIDTKDHYTYSHSENVTKYALLIAKKMGLKEKEIREIEQACQMHDLGKIGIHDYVLAKKDKLSRKEREEIETHSLKGVEILKPLPFLNRVVELVKQHHERYDGEGYPGGEKGNNIRIGARIMAVADAYDAMVSERPYREKALTQDEAIEELKRNRGTQFDPVVVEAFLGCVEDGEIFME